MDPSFSRGVTRSDSSNEYASQFKATQTWNRIAKEFREKMPTKKRWRQLRSFENSFTGKEATDFMLTILPGLLPNKKPITRDSCVALLQKFADNHLFKYAWTTEKTTFQDNATLFVWEGDSTLNGICRTPVLVRRASSFNNGSADRPRRMAATTPKPPVIAAPDNWKTFELPKSPPKHKPSRNRRLSSSTGNLSLIGVDKFDSLLSPRMGDRVAIIEEGPSTPEKREERSEVEYGEIRNDKKKEKIYDGIGRRIDYVYGEIGKKAESVYGEIGKKKREPVYVTPKAENMKEDGKPPTPTLLKSSPVYASFIKREERSDYDKENNYEYVTFRRKHGPHTTPSKGSKRSAHSVKEKKGNDSNQMKSVISRLTPSRFKGKENETIEKSPPGPSVPPPSTRTVRTVRREEPIYSSIRIRPRAVLTDNDEWNVYSTALLNRVRSLMGYMGEREMERDSLITWRVDGQHVKWSCKYHPMGKVVRAMKQNDDFPPSVLQQMEYLKYFPFHTKSVNVITYTDKQEVKVFRTVVAHLNASAPLLEASVGHSFLTVINHFKSLSRPLSRPNSGQSVISASSVSSVSSGTSGRLETAFSVGSPTTRLLNDSCISPSNELHPKEHVYATPVPFHARVIHSGDTMPMMDSSPIPTTLSTLTHLTHGHTLHVTPPQGPLKVDPKSGIKARDILMEPLGDRILRLPGLKHSPDLIERIKNLSPRVSAIPFPMDLIGRSSPMLVSPVLEGICIEMEPALYETLQLILLSLPVGTRRKLQLLLKFINDISNNHCLTLQEDRENRYVALDELCDYIMSASDEYSIDSPLTHSERVNLVSMMIDNESKLFRIPDDFDCRVENVLMERRRTKLEFDDTSPTMAPPAPNYCQRIQPQVYSANMQDTNYSLRSLLEEIASNQRMTVSDREKKLKAFEKSHPSIFYERFPERLHKKQEGGFLNKLFRSRNE